MYTLYNKDIKLVDFNIKENLRDNEYEIIKVYDENRSLI